MPTTRATKAAKTTEDMQQEIEALRKEVSEMMALLKDKSSNYAHAIGEKAEEKLEDYQESIKENAEAVYEKGAEGVEEVSQRVKKNPIASLCLAFGVGYAISKLIDQGK